MEVRTGASIAIFWDLDRKWYTGEVLSYNPATGICKILYSDGEREELDLTAVKHSILRAGKLRERMGKSGGGIGGSSKEQPIDTIVETLLDIEDRLPPRGVHNNKKRWWAAWHSRVTNAGKSGNVLELGKAAVEIAFQMNDDVSTSWWKSQRLDWQKKVESSTIVSALSSRVNDLLTKAVDWTAARILFFSELPEESDRKENTAMDKGKDRVKMDRSGPEKGIGRPGTRQHLIMVKEKIDSKAGRKVDEDSSLKKSTSNSTPRALRHSKRKLIIEDDEELSHVDSPEVGTADGNLVLDENRASLIKKQKKQKAEEGRLSDGDDHKSDKARSETVTQGDQSSVDETEMKKKRRKGRSSETANHDQGTEDAQESAIDHEIHTGNSRLRSSKRSLELDYSEAGQTLEKTPSGRKVQSVSAEPTLEAGSAIGLISSEKITQLKDAKLPVRSSPRRPQKSTVMQSPRKSRLRNGTSPKVSVVEESTQECRSVKDGLQQREPVLNVQVQGTPGRPKRTKLGKEDGVDGEEKIREPLSTQECLSVDEDLQHLEQVPDVQVQRKHGQPKKTKFEKVDGVDGKEKISNGTESPGTSAAKNRGLSVQDLNVARPEPIVAQIETRLRQVGNTGVEIGCSTYPVGRSRREVKKPKIYDAVTVESLKPAKAQSDGTQRRMVIRGGVKQINLSNGAEAGETKLNKTGRLKNIKSSDVSNVTKAGKQSRRNSAAKVNSTLGFKVMALGEGQDGAGPSMDANSVDVTPKRRGRLVRKVSESKLTEKEGGQESRPNLLVEAERPARSLKQVKGHVVGTAPQDGSVILQNETNGDAQVKELLGEKSIGLEAGFSGFKQQQETPVKIDEELEFLGEIPGTGSRRNSFRHETSKKVEVMPSSARPERTRVWPGGDVVEVLDEDGTEESSEEEEQNTRMRYDRSVKRKILRSQSSDSNYEETASGSSSEEDSDLYKVEDDAQNPDIMDSWGERLPTDDSEGDDLPSEAIKQLESGQAGPSLEPRVTSQDVTLAEETCASCNFAGSDELMLLCDQSGCTCAMHTFCLTPPLECIPEGEWLCPHCTRLKAHPSDNRRLPRTCSGGKYPPKSLGAIIGRRGELLQEGTTKIQYLVKWDAFSHEHDSWIPEDWLLHMNNRMVQNFQRKYPLSSIDANLNVDERRSEWLKVDRIIACRKRGSKWPIKPSQVRAVLLSRGEGKTGVEFLVKWHFLEHKGATWEEERDTEEFQQAISSYIERHERGEESALSKDNGKSVAATIKSQPDYLRGGDMYGFQLHGLKWLLSNFEQKRSVILADEMGLGKTIQALAFISCVRREKMSPRPALVVAPKSTLPGWEQEFRRWSPFLNVVVYQGDKENRALIREYEFHTASKKPLFDVLLTSYELASSDNTLLSRFHWASLLVDEGQRVKNFRAKLGVLLKRHTADFRLLLTGTPVQNTLTELFALLHFLDPAGFPDPEGSAREFTEVDAQSNKGQSDAKLIEQQVSKLHELLNPRMLRRLKTEVLRDMIPGKKLVEVTCAMTAVQRHLYITILKRNFKVLNKGVKSGMKRSLQSILTDLKMVCNHPYLIPGKEPQLLEPAKAFQMMVDASGKLQLLEKLLPLLKEQGHRVLLFSQMTKMLDILEDFVIYLGLRYSRIDGSSSASSRQKSISEFNAPDSSTFIFLISTRAGGLGINLPTADTVIIYDIDFNPFVDLQAQARAHRIGQDKTVLVYQLTTTCSVEEKILQRSRKKLAMENLVMSRDSKETAADINTLLIHGAEKVLDENDKEATSIKFTDESVKKLLNRELLTSTINDDEPTAHGYLGAVQGDGLISPIPTEQEDQESKGRDGSEWHELLHHMVEEEVKEDLGRGKRLRKQVVYAVEGHGDGLEEEEYDPSSHSESSADSDLSIDSDGVSRKHSQKAVGLGMGGVPTGQYPSMSTIPGSISNSHYGAGTSSQFIPGDAEPFRVAFVPRDNQYAHPWHLNSTFRTPSTMSGSANMELPRPPQEATSLGIVGSTSTAPALTAGEVDSFSGLFRGLVPTSKASSSHASRGATSSQAAAKRDRFVHISPRAGALPSTPLLSGAGPNSAYISSPPPVPFQGVYPYMNNPALNANVNPYAAASYLTIPGPPYAPSNAQPLPIQPVPPPFLFTDGRVDTQSPTNRNPAWPSFANLQQATHTWRMSDDLQQATHSWPMSHVGQMSTIAVSGIAQTEGGGYMQGGHRGTIGVRPLPTTSASSFQITPSSVQSGSGAAHQPPPNPRLDQRVSSSSHLSSAAAAPWLAGYYDVSSALSCQVDPPKVISASLATLPVPVPVPAVPVMATVPHPYPAFEYHDPTVLQVPPTLRSMSSSAIAPQPLAGRAPTAVYSTPSELVRRGAMTNHYPPAPKLTDLDSVKPAPSLDRNGSSSVLLPVDGPLITLPYVGSADSMPDPDLHNGYPRNSTTLQRPETLQSPVYGTAVGRSSSQARAHVVGDVFKGGVSTGQVQPAVAAFEEQVVNEGDSSDLPERQAEGSGPSSASKQLPQGRKPLWVPKGDAGMLMGHSQDHGVLPPPALVKVEEVSLQESSMHLSTSSQVRRTK